MIKKTATISIESISDIHWGKENTEYQLKINNIHIWKIRVPKHFHTLLKDFRMYLSQEEYIKAKTFYWEKDFRNYITSRIVVKILYNKYLNQPIPSIIYNEKTKKPNIGANSISFKYNLSHSDQYLIISVSKSPTGIDIEKINYHFKFSPLLSTCFDSNEVNNIETSKESYKNFFLQWTRKEAILKFTGQGIIDDLSYIPSLDGVHQLTDRVETSKNINLTSFMLDNDYVGSIVYPSNISELNFIEWGCKEN